MSATNTTATARQSELLTLEEAAALLGYSRQTVWRLRDLGLLRTVTPEGMPRCVRISRKEIQAFIERNTSDGDPKVRRKQRRRP